MTNFKVAYIHPAPHGRAQHSHVPLDGFQNQPAGLIGALNAVARRGVELVGLNEAIELRLDHSFSLADWLDRESPDLVLIELHWYVHTHGAQHAARMAKHALPDVPVVMGGLTATAFADDILGSWPEVDMVLEGEVEQPLPDLVTRLQSGQPLAAVENLWRRDEHYVMPPSHHWSAKTLAEFDHADLSWLVHRAEFERSDFPYRNRWLLTGRGCAHACFFCGGSAPSLARSFGRTRVIQRPPEHVAADIIRLAKSGAEAVNVTHDLFGMGRGYWEPLFGLVRQAGVAVGLGNESWGPIPDDDVLDAWAHTFDVSRSYIALSPTSAWSGLAALASKNADSQTLFHAMDTMAARRLPLHVFFLLNLPGETTATLERTMDLASAVLRRYPAELLRLESQPAPIDPRSPAAMGLTKGFRFRAPTLDDYLAVSRGEFIAGLSWPEDQSGVDPGVPAAVPRAKPREIMALTTRCPSFADRWRDLLRTERKATT